MNRLFSVVVGLGIGLVIAFAVVTLGPGGGPAPASLTGTLVDPPLPIEDFTLDAGSGPVSLSDLEGKWVVLFFGYTSCPDVCPFTLVHLHEAMEELGPDLSSQAKVVFITVDPERDSPRRVADYVAQFNPGFIGLSGTAADLEAVREQLGIVVEPGGSTGDGGYLVDHTASLRVLDPQGRMRLILPFDASGPQMADDLRELMR
jgi:protein SCO1/2